MFTGYHTSQALIQLAFESAGITDARLSAITKMERDHAERWVHKLVAEFLQLRFPILLALNKVDLANAIDNVDKFKAQFTNMTMVPVSAKSECFLQQKCKEGVIFYQSGASHFDINTQSQQNMDGSDKELAHRKCSSDDWRHWCLASFVRSCESTFTNICLSCQLP